MINFQKKIKYFKISKVSVAAVTLGQTLVLIEKIIRSRQQGKTLFTINLDHLQKIAKNEKFKQAYLKAGLVVADGMPIVWLSKLFGQTPLPDRVNGTSLVKKILLKPGKNKVKIFLFGDKKETLKKIKKKYPQASIVGAISPSFKIPFSQWPNKSHCRKIRKSGANILLVALGPPKQELWLEQNLHQSGAKIGIGVGSALTLLSGIKKRAPVWIQNLGLEWLFRLVQEPKRLGKRYFSQIVFLPKLVLNLQKQYR